MISVILLMAGRGRRMGYARNKMLLPFGDKYLYEIPLMKFLNKGYEVICVIAEEDRDIIVPRLPIAKVKYVYGGKTRSESVMSGLKAATGKYVMIHDAARMFVHEEVINEVAEMIEDGEVVLTYSSCKDTVKYKDGDKIKTLDRNNILLASTPQAGPLDLFKEVYEKAMKDNYSSTDDVSLIEKYHPEIKIQTVCDESLKVTTPIDYEVALALWRKEQ